VTEMMARAGFDWLVIDMEHTAITVGECHQMIQIADLAKCPPMVRVGANDPLLIKHAMDAGAYGVVVPMVNSRAEAEAAAAALRYPPRGRRGAGLARAQQYGMGFEAYRTWCEEEAILVVQIEHIRAVESLEEILAVEDVDAFIIGPYDLSASLNKPGQFDHPDVAAALARVEEVMRRSRPAGGFHVVHSDESRLRRVLAAGYRFIAYGDDMIFLAEKLKDVRSTLDRELASEKRS
jgi:2-keto-3-deoxy-L-rhamnonate aldolase RhmA